MILHGRENIPIVNHMSTHKRNIGSTYNIPMSNKADFAKRLQIAFNEAARRSPGKSQVHHAKAMGISQSTVSKYLNGIAMPATDTAITMANYLKVNFEWLMTGRGPMDSKEAALDHLDLTGLPEDSKVALRAAVYQIKEQAAAYNTNKKSASNGN